MSDKVSEERSGSGKIRTLHEDHSRSHSTRNVSGSYPRRFLNLWPFWSVLALAAALAFWGIGDQGTSLAPRVMGQKMEILAALRVSLLKSVESEKRAVMADTDEASLAFAQESRQASDAVEAARNQLAELIKLHPAEDETRLLNEFDENWEQLRKLDQHILELAVQNTNLKAAALSFGQATEAVHRFQSAMEELTQGSDNIRIVRSASEALAAVLTIQTLHAPHIASADDGEMSRIEQIIREKEEVIRRCLDQLGQTVPGGRRNEVIQAGAAFNEYIAMTRQVLEWSRQNTNVTSLEISLNRKLKMTAQSEAILNKLQEAIKGREFKATR
jgi:hypothetical protein